MKLKPKDKWRENDGERKEKVADENIMLCWERDREEGCWGTSSWRMGDAEKLE